MSFQVTNFSKMGMCVCMPSHMRSSSRVACIVTCVPPRSCAFVYSTIQYCIEYSSIASFISSPGCLVSRSVKAADDCISYAWANFVKAYQCILRTALIYMQANYCVIKMYCFRCFMIFDWFIVLIIWGKILQLWSHTYPYMISLASQ